MTAEHDRADEGTATLSLLADALEPQTPRGAVRERLLGQLRKTERYAPFADEVAATFGLSKEIAGAALSRIPDASAWQPGVFPGSRFLSTPELLQAQVVIAGLPAGVVIPEHGHPCRELTYVLDGVLADSERGHIGAGELLAKEPGSTHALSVQGDAECLVVFSLQDTASRHGT